MILLIVAFIIPSIFCITYIGKEIRRRKLQKNEIKILETNWDIRGAVLVWSMGTTIIIGFTIAYFFNVFKTTEFWGYISLCFIGLLFIVIAFFLAFRKIKVQTENGDIFIYAFIKIRRYNVKDITLIKHTAETWKVYSNGKKLFTVRDRYYNGVSELYIYIRNHCECKEETLNGFVSRK